MKIGFSLSPGGLLLPYHLGVLDALQYRGWLNAATPVAGSSAGAIAAVCYATRIDSRTALDTVVDISDQCQAMGGARGRLLPLLREKLDYLLKEEHLEALRERQGKVAVAYREVFPMNRPVHQTEFTDRFDLIRAVCHSSTFPFFTTYWPAALDVKAGRFPRVVVDGFFAVPSERFGCPDFESAGIHVDRTITVSCFPKEQIGLDASTREDCICPMDDDDTSLMDRFKIATQPSSRAELTEVYEAGWSDGERWCNDEESRESLIQSSLQQ